MMRNKRVRDNQNIYCYCKSDKDVLLYKKHINEFQILVSQGYVTTNTAITISQLIEDKSDKIIYVCNEDDKSLLSNHFSNVVNITRQEKISCHRFMLSVNSFGDVFPCCRQIYSMKIGNIREDDIIHKVLNFSPKFICNCSIGQFENVTHISHVLYLNIELAGYCNGECVYCFQRTLPTFKKEIEIYKELETFIMGLKPKSIMIFGGEIGVQERTITLLETLYNRLKLDISIATNAYISENQLIRLLKFVKSFQVTFNGFSTQTVRAVSRIDFKQQKNNTEKLLNEHITSVKFLINPINILELPSFLEWALAKPFDHVIIDVTIVTPKDYLQSNNWGKSILSANIEGFWEGVFSSIKENVKDVIRTNLEKILCYKTALIICPEIMQFLGLDTTFFESLGLSDQLVAKSITISTKAWRTLL